VSEDFSNTYLDLAGLADFEVEAGTPLLWPSYAQLVFLRRIKDAPWRTGESSTYRYLPFWNQFAGVIVRWGDPRINRIMEFWRSKIEDLEDSLLRSQEDSAFSFLGIRQEAARQSYFRLHGRSLYVVFADCIYHLAIIPKALGIPDPDSDEDELLHPEFDPESYHGYSVGVFQWFESDNQVQYAVAAMVGKTPIYLELDDYFLQLQGGSPVDRTPQSVENTLTPQST
jgi:hypothetical protein